MIPRATASKRNFLKTHKIFGIAVVVMLVFLGLVFTPVDCTHHRALPDEPKFQGETRDQLACNATQHVLTTAKTIEDLQQLAKYEGLRIALAAKTLDKRKVMGRQFLNKIFEVSRKKETAAAAYGRFELPLWKNFNLLPEERIFILLQLECVHASSAEQVNNIFRDWECHYMMETLSKDQRSKIGKILKDKPYCADIHEYIRVFCNIWTRADTLQKIRSRIGNARSRARSSFSGFLNIFKKPSPTNSSTEPALPKSSVRT